MAAQLDLGAPTTSVAGSEGGSEGGGEGGGSPRAAAADADARATWVSLLAREAYFNGFLHRHAPELTLRESESAQQQQALQEAERRKRGIYEVPDHERDAKGLEMFSWLPEEASALAADLGASPTPGHVLAFSVVSYIGGHGRLGRRNGFTVRELYVPSLASSFITHDDGFGPEAYVISRVRGRADRALYISAEAAQTFAALVATKAAHTAASSSAMAQLAGLQPAMGGETGLC
jgi:hypothetical protein